MKDYEQIISTLLAKIAGLEKVVQEQAARIAELEKCLNKNSSNSSKPPSNVDRLVYFEICSGIVLAIEREKQIKGWSRKKKQDLIHSLNPEWDDLYSSLC